MKTKRQIQKENTRKKILNAAYQVYVKEGFTATTARIAKEAGISHGTIFVHFQTVSELLECLIEGFGADLALEIHGLVKASSRVEELLKKHLEILIRHEEFYLRLITQRSLLPAEVQYTFADTQSTVACQFNRIFEQEIKKQTMKEVPVHMVFNTWMGLIHYYLCNKDFFSPEEPVLERYKDELVNAFLKLIKK